MNTPTLIKRSRGQLSVQSRVVREQKTTEVIKCGSMTYDLSFWDGDKQVLIPREIDMLVTNKCFRNKYLKMIRDGDLLELMAAAEHAWNTVEDSLDFPGMEQPPLNRVQRYFAKICAKNVWAKTKSWLRRMGLVARYTLTTITRRVERAVATLRKDESRAKQEFKRSATQEEHDKVESSSPDNEPDATDNDSERGSSEPGSLQRGSSGNQSPALNKGPIGPLGNLAQDMERFNAKVELINGHHLWTGAVDRDGYGNFWADGTTHRAHVWLADHIEGPAPKGHERDHECRERRCVRFEPGHVQTKTKAANLARRIWN